MNIPQNSFKRTAATVSLVNYHFVFCPRYRRKIFDLPNVEDRFKQIIWKICAENDIDILALECHHDHVHLFVSVYPTSSIPDVMHRIKGTTSRILRSEFPSLRHMPSLWTRSYFVSTAGNVSSETIKRYIDTQKTRD